MSHKIATESWLCLNLKVLFQPIDQGCIAYSGKVRVGSEFFQFLRNDAFNHCRLGAGHVGLAQAGPDTRLGEGLSLAHNLALLGQGAGGAGVVEEYQYSMIGETSENPYQHCVCVLSIRFCIQRYLSTNSNLDERKQNFNLYICRYVSKVLVCNK